jgi:hypothetical protein
MNVTVGMPEILVVLSFFFFPISKITAIICLIIGLLSRGFQSVVAWDKDTKFVKKEEKVLILHGKEDKTLH